MCAQKNILALCDINLQCMNKINKSSFHALPMAFRSSGRSMLHKKSKVEFHPLGVIGAIVSWNYPFHNIFNPMLAAVFSGNSVVIKVRNCAL